MKQFPQSNEIRRNMVDSQLRTNGVNAPWIVAAMLATPREAFVPHAEASAYADRAVPLGNGRMLNPPLAAGMMLSLADPVVSDRVLLIGAGSGYLAALLGSRVAHIIAVEEDAALSAAFRQNLPEMTLVEGRNAAGAPDHAPFDLIIIDGAIETMPQPLVEQLAEGGRIVSGLIEGPVSRLASGIKHSEHVTLRAVADIEVAPLPGFAKMREFVF